MRTRSPLLVVGALAALVCTPAIAQSTADSRTTQKVMASGTAVKSQAQLPPSMRTPVIDKRLEQLRRAIVRGVESGKLTTGEAHSLSTKWEHVRRDQETAAHNNIITPRERHRLRKQIADLADDVFKQTRDESVREPAN